MGSGTTGIASLKLNRKFIGIGIDPPFTFQMQKEDYPL
jgi:DNA modification methylase